ncbi:hypothetical protein ACHAXA_001767 [Cyclostephanos tholiformis]|uniref:Protein kinase domain-containing protein n=1 Tax=Cyclostephanos tholiformis TaxID=382380 RepID=A0ABD3RYB2_9STRA
MESHHHNNPSRSPSSSHRDNDRGTWLFLAPPAPTPAPTPILKSSASSSSSSSSSSDFSLLASNDVDERGDDDTGGRSGSRKRRALSSVDFAKEVAVIMGSKLEQYEKEESETDVGEDEDEEGEGSPFHPDRVGEEKAGAPPLPHTPTLAARKGRGSRGEMPSSVSRMGAKIRRLNLTDDNNEEYPHLVLNVGGHRATHNDVQDYDDGERSPLDSPSGKRRSIEGHRRPPSSVVSAGWGGRREEGVASRPFPDDPHDCNHHRRKSNDNDDVSPRDVINFPSFANFDSPSQEAKCGAGGVSGDGDDDEHRLSTRSPPSLGIKFPRPIPSTARKTKDHHRRCILNDSNDDDDDDDAMMTSLDALSSSTPPAPRGLRTFGRANSFMQMFSIGGCHGSDMSVEGENVNAGGGSVGGGDSRGPSKERNDVDDDFIRKPDGSVRNDSGFVTSSPGRPIRQKVHRRYTPASPRYDCDGDGGASFSRFVSDFEVVGTLGDGSFGSVYSVRNRTDKRLYAIKAAKREARGSSDRDRMLQEVFALSALSDKACVSSMHIVRYYQAWMEGNRLYIQTELCDGTLRGQMRGSLPMDERGRYKLLREMLLALDLVHKTGMIHLDIKPENIFIKNGCYKLGDFGLVSKIESHDDVEEGDSRYMSMELLLGVLDDLTKSDIFSLGATMYEICMGRLENLPENGQEWQDIRQGKLLPMPNTAIELQTIVRDMMAPDWITRPSADNLLKRRQLLSDEQQQLIVERNKTNVANMALDAQKERFKALTPRKFHRSNTIC